MTLLTWLKVAFVAFSLAITSVSLAADDPQGVVEQTALLNINTADAEAIAAALDGIGLVKAREIVAHREMFGKFESVDELIEVQGIGAATVEKNRNRILIEKN